MKRAFLIHGWEGYPKEGWRPWLKNELKKKKFKVEIPAMPDTKHPKMNAWVGYMKKVVSNPNKECYFIGHSLGCIAILRYIEGINNEVGGIVMVAGFSDNLGYEELSSFFEKPINWEKIKKNCKKIITIFSDNDPYVSLKYADIFKEKLKAKIIIQKNMKHFSGDDGITELPVVLNEILEIAK